MENNGLEACLGRRPLLAALGLFAVTLTGWAPRVSAQTADSTPSVAASSPSAPFVTVGDIDAIMQDKALLDALSARAKARAEFNQFSINDTVNPSVTLPTIAWRRPTSVGWLAKFVYPNGAFAVASIGETLPGGLKVVRIDADDVQISDATGKKISVAPARLATQPQTSQADSAQKTPTLMRTPSGIPSRQPDFALPPAMPGQ